MKQNIFFVVMFTVCNLVAFSQTGNIVIPNGHSENIKKVLIDKQGKYLYSIEHEKIVKWDNKTYQQLYSFPLAFEAGDVEYSGIFIVSNDGNKIAVSGIKGYKCFSTVTGKLLSASGAGKGSYIQFSANSNKIYYTDKWFDSQTIKTLNGISEFDFTNENEKHILSGEYYQFEPLDNGKILMYHPQGWKVIDLDNNKEIFSSTIKEMTFKSGRDMVTRKFKILPSLNLVTSFENTLPTRSLIFYDLYSGNILKKLEIDGSEYKLIPSVDNKEFILLPDMYNSSKIAIYNASTFELKKSINLNNDVSEGLFLGSSRTAYLSSFNSIIAIDINSGDVIKKFEQTVSLGSFRKFNTITNQLYFMDNGASSNVWRYNANAADSKYVYKSFDFNRLVAGKSFPVSGKELVSYPDVKYSNSGDTIAIFDNNKGHILNVKTNTRVPFSNTLISLKPSDITERPNYFFSKMLNTAYYFTVVKQGSDVFLNTINRINLKTQQSQKIFTYKTDKVGENVFIDEDNEVITFWERVSKTAVFKTWDLITGKQIFTKTLPVSDNFVLLQAKASVDKARITLLSNDFTNTFTVASGDILFSSPGYSSYDPKGRDYYDISNDALKVVEIENDGRISVRNSASSKLSYTIQAHNSKVHSSFFSPDDKLIYTFGNDQSIKIWDATTGRLYGTLYLFKDNDDYVFITPDGRFDGTEGGMKKLYYYKDRQKVPLDVVYEIFYTPNLYQRLVNGEKFSPINININPSPLVKISYEQKTRNLLVEDDGRPSYTNTTGLAEITIKASAQSDKVEEIRLFHNGKIVNLATRNLFVSDDVAGTDSKNYIINLLPGQNTFRAVALNSQRTESQPDEIEVLYKKGNEPVIEKPVKKIDGVIVDAVDKNATLHLIVVGINQYQNKTMSLNYALADATSFKEEVEKDAKSIIANIKTYFVTENAADKNGITNAFKQVQQNAQPQDVFIFYYAGHGVIGKDKEFYLVPKDVSDLNNVQTELEQKGIPSKMLQQYAIDIQAQKQLFILDACQSAGAFSSMLAASGDQQKNIAVVARSTGTHWIAASGAKQYANEFASLGHGVFTYALLKALQGEAVNNKMITVNNLKTFLQLQVPALMIKYNGAEQYPASYGFGNDFPVEVIK